MPTESYCIYKNKLYYYSKDIKKKYPKLFKGVKTIRGILQKKKIEEQYYIYAYKKNDKLIVCDSNYAKAKLLLREDWLYKNIDDFINNILILKKVPQKLELNENEVLLNNQGQIIPLELYGNKIYDECYFDINNVNKFINKNIMYLILDKHKKKYIENVHYSFFNDAGKKKLFLSLIGFIKLVNNYCKNLKTLYNVLKWCNIFYNGNY